MSVAVISQPRRGAWHQIGTEGGVPPPEHVSYSSDDFGPVAADLQLAYAPGEFLPQGERFTPTDIWIDGVPVFMGDVRETPTRADDRVVALSLRGRQANLDDDVFHRVYVHSRVSEWQDVGGHPDAPPSFREGAGVVTAGVPVMSLKVPAANVGYAGVYLDTVSGVDEFVLAWSGVGPLGTLYVFGVDSMADLLDLFTGGDWDAVDTDIGTGSAVVTFTAPRRYVAVVLWKSDFGAGDHLAYLYVMTAGQAQFLSGGTPILTDDDVVKDALPTAPLIGQATDRISPGPVVIPHFTTEGQATPRETDTRAVSYASRQLRVVDDGTLELRDRPSVALFEAGDWPGAASAADLSTELADGDFNAAVVEGTDVDGTGLTVRVEGDGLATERGFTRTQIIQPLGPSGVSEATALGVGFIEEHSHAPVRGTMVVVGNDGLRWVRGGQGVPAYVLPLYIGERVRLNRPDPVTGAWGFDVRIVDATYDRDTRSTTLSLDSSSTKFEEQLARTEMANR